MFRDLPGLGLLESARPGRAMQLIEALEPVRRGPYCGAALWVDAAGAMGSSILIRTFVADGPRPTLHVGGGITWRSDAAAEWEETRANAAVRCARSADGLPERRSREPESRA